MTTQSTSGLNLLGSLFASPKAGSQNVDITDSFQSYVSASERNQTVTESDRQMNAERTEVSHQDVYKAEGSQTERYDTVKKQASKAKEAGEVADAGEASKEQLEALASEIRNYLKETMELDDEQLDELLAQLNMNILQLLQPENLQSFLLTAMDKSPLDLVTDSALTDLLQNMQASLQELADMYDFASDAHSMEQLTELLNELSKGKAAAEDIQQPDASEQAEDIQPEAKTGQAVEDTGVKEDLDGFHVKEEETGIDVAVQTQGGSRKEADGSKSEQDVAGGIVHNLAQAVQEAEPAPMAFQTDIRQTEILQQIIEQIKVYQGNDVQKMEVQLYPEHLGKVQIQVAMKSGVMTAQITAETEIAKTAIESQLVQLKEAFEQQNLKVEAVEVSVATPEFQNQQEKQDAMNQQEDRSVSGKRRFRNVEFDEDEEEELEAELLQAQGASVEFQA